MTIAMQRSRLLCGLGLALTFVFAGPAFAKLPKIGVPAAVRPAAHGTPPGAESRILHVDLDLHANEEIATGATGQTHLLFRDGSTISIGPNSNLRLDKFVYDPDSKQGELVASLSKGVFRFVGGRISKSRPVLFKTAESTIGIRGGVALMEVNTPAQIAQARAQGRTLPPVVTTMLYGDQVFIQTPSQRRIISRPGFSVMQTTAGGVTAPQQTSQTRLTRVLSKLEDPQIPPGGGSGGGTQSPRQLGQIAPAAGGPAVSNDDVASSQIAELGSDNDPASVGGGGNAPPPTVTVVDPTANADEIIVDAQGFPVVPNSLTGLSDVNPDPEIVIESAGISTLVGVRALAVSDNDAAGVTYSLGDNAGGRFAIDPVTGEVTVANGDLLDFESSTSYVIEVVATSDDGSSLSATFQIALSDDNTEFQVSSISDGNADANLATENVANGTPVGVTTIAQDNDGTDSVTYSLTNDAGGRFSIDPVTGVISVADGGLLDFESVTVHTVTVAATSSDGSVSSNAFSIALSDDNSEFDVTPIVDSDANPQTFGESVANGTSVGVMTLATDADGSDTITYSLTNDAGGRFAIDPVTGVISVANTALVDFESATTHTVAARATSTDGSTSDAVYTLSLTDDTSEFSASAITDANASDNVVPETAANGTAVGVSAFSSDGDASDNISYSLIDDAAGRFTINGSTGVVTVANTSLLEFTTAGQHNVTAKALSTDGSQSTSSFFIDLTTTTFEGRAKFGTDTAVGTNDAVALSNVGLISTLTGNGAFFAETAAGDFDLYLPDSPSDFTFGGANFPNDTPLGGATGDGYFAPDRDFVFYQVTPLAGGSRAIVYGGVPTPAPQIPTTGFYSYEIDPDFGLGSTPVPFVRSSAGGAIAGNVVSPLYISWDTSGGDGNPYPVFAQVSRVSDSNGKGGLVVATGLVLTDGSGDSFLTGGVSGSMNPNSGSGDNARLITGAIASSDDNNGKDLWGLNGPKNLVFEAAAVDALDAVLSRGMSETSAGEVADRVTTTYYPNLLATGGPDAGVGLSRTSGTFKGFATGELIHYAAGGPGASYSLARSTTGDGTDLVIGVNKNESQLSASIKVKGEFFDVPEYILILGGQNGNIDSAFIDDNLYAARESTTINSTRDGTPSDKRAIAFVSNGMVPLLSSEIPAGVTLCGCSFMRWGFWSADLELPGGDTDRFHLAHWVAGDIANAGAVAALAGTASFGGHAIGTINDSGVRQFVADMSTSYNFTSRTGTVTLTNIESQNFQFGISASVSSEHRFSGPMTVGPGAYSGDTRGAFFDDGVVAKGIGGDFYLKDIGTGASMVGIYVGEQ